MSTERYSQPLMDALLRAADGNIVHNDAIVRGARHLALNATAISEVEADACMDVLKSKGYKPASISRYFGKPTKRGVGGLWSVGRANPALMREWLADNGPLAGISNPDDLCKAVQKKIKLLNSVQSASSGDPVADAISLRNAEVAAETEKAGKAIRKSGAKLAAPQMAGAILTMLQESEGCKQRRFEYLSTLCDILADAAEDYRKDLESMQQAATA